MSAGELSSLTAHAQDSYEKQRMRGNRLLDDVATVAMVINGHVSILNTLLTRFLQVNPGPPVALFIAVKMGATPDATKSFTDRITQAMSCHICRLSLLVAGVTHPKKDGQSRKVPRDTVVSCTGGCLSVPELCLLTMRQ